MLLITSIMYLIYVYYVFYYAARIFDKPMIKMKPLSIIAALNTFLIYLPSYIMHFNNEWLFMIIYFIILGLEIHMVFKQPLTDTISALLCFIINYFALRYFFVALFANNQGIHILEYVSDTNNTLRVTLFTFVTIVPYIIASSKILIAKNVKYIFKDFSTIKLCAILLGLVCVNQLAGIPSLYLTSSTPAFNNLYQIRLSMFSLMCFVIIMAIVFTYSHLKRAAVSFLDTSSQIDTNTKFINELESEINLDYSTGFYVRSVATDKLEEFLSANMYCYIAFIDIDGLKIVNDNFSHNEGDVYIDMVSEKVRTIFKEDTIARIGGDEFLIVGNSQGEKSISEKVHFCYNEVAKQKHLQSLPYDTSVSYGFIEVDNTNELSASQLIDIADKKMYEFKKSRNKERKV